MLINQVIVDSKKEGSTSPHKKKKIVRVRKHKTQIPPKVNENQEQNLDKEEKPEDPAFILPFPHNDGVRIIDEGTSYSQVRDFYQAISDQDFFTSTITRKKVLKANGTRLFFSYTTSRSSEIYIAKAKHDFSEEIPICSGDTIHLSSSSFDGKLISKEGRSRFSLVNMAGIPILDVSFNIARTKYDGARRMAVYLYPTESTEEKIPLPLSLTSKPTTSLPQFESLFRKISVKNAFLGIDDDDEDRCFISIRKTAKNEIKVDSILKLPDIQIFALAIASFLGKESK